MKTYLSNIIPRVKRYSEKLDNMALLMNNHWNVLDEESDRRMVYIFRENKQLLISNNGRVTKANWEYLGNNSLLIENNQDSYLFNLGFFDKNILALKVDSKNEYAFLINENKIGEVINTIERVNNYLVNRYIQNVSKSKTKENKQEISSGILVPFETDKGRIEARLPYKDHFPIQGVKVLKNGKKAPTGKYKLGFMHFIHVKDGEVTKVSIF